MTWIILALTSYFFWSLVNIGDKYIISNKIKSPYVYLLLLTFLGLGSVIIIPFIDFFIPDAQLMLLLVLGGVVYFFGGLPYVKAVQIEDITRINIWWNLIPFFTLIISWIAINEHLSTNQLVAFGILTSGAIIASLHVKQKKFIISRALPLMIISAISYSIYAVILRYISQEIPFLVAFIWNSLIMGIASLTLFLSPTFRKDFSETINKMNLKLGSSLASIVALEQGGILFNIWALSLGPVALVFALEGTQTIFVFLLAIMISINRPRILREELDKSNIILKLLALILIIIGVVLINLT